MLLLVSLAVAGPTVTCEEVLGMVDAGLPPEAIVAGLAGTTISPEGLECIREADVPPTVFEALNVPASEPGAVPAEAARTEPQPQVIRQVVYMDDSPPLQQPACVTSDVMLSTPSPAVAGALGVAVGFGSGHIYAGNVPAGLLFLVADVGLTVGALAAPYAGAPLGVAVGLGIAVVLIRMVEGPTAALAAEEHRAAAFQACEQ